MNPIERIAVRAKQLAIVTQPSDAVSGAPIITQPVVEVRDANNAKVPGDTTSVTAEIAVGTGTLAGTTTVKAADGVAAFTDLTVNGAGTQVIAFTSQGLDGATASTIVVAQPPGTVLTPAALAVQTQPGGAMSGAPLATQPVVRILDGAGLLIASGPNSTLSVTATRTTGSGTLTGTTTVDAVGGVATFTDLQITGSGSQVLSFSISSPALQVASIGFGVSAPAAGPAALLAIAAQPTTATSGLNFTAPIIEVRDAVGNLTTSTAVVSVAIASGSGTLGGIPTVNAIGGVATFGNLRINGSGPHTLSIASTGLTGATSSAIDVTQKAAALAIQTQPTSATSGAPFPTAPVIEVLDNAGLLVANSALAVTVTRSAGSGILSGTTKVNAVNGVATFSDLLITGTGTYSLTFTATGVPSATSSSFPVASVVGPPTMLVITTQPNGAASGVSLTTQPVVQIRDARGTLVTGAADLVTATIASGSGTLAGTTAVAAVNGVATFSNLSITGSGSHALTFSASGLSSAVSSGFTVSSGVGAATQLAVTTQPAGAVSGASFTTQPLVQVRDANNSLVSQSTASVTASVATGSGVLSGTTTVNASGGAAAFTDLTITGTGLHTLAFASSGLSSANSTSITLSGAATKLSITTQPSTSSPSGGAFAQQPAMQLRDASNNAVSQAGVVVTAAIASGGGSLSGTITATTNVSGIATFTDLAISGTVGPKILRFTAPSLTLTTSGTITLVAGQPTQLSFLGTPSDAAESGVTFTQQPVIQLRDASNNNAGQSAVAVTAAIASGGGTLGGTATVTTNAAGSAVFTDLSITGTPGARTLSFNASSLSGALDTISISGPPTQLAVFTQPGGAFSGSAFSPQPIVLVLDAGGNRVGSSTASVTATIASGTGTLLGTATVTAINGVAFFTNLAINGTGDHTLTFTSGVLTPVTSNTVTVASALLVSHDFENGTLGGFYTESGAAVAVVNDPSGLRGGKVVSIRYQDPGPRADINKQIKFDPPNMGLGKSLFFRGYLYFPPGTANFENIEVQRKILYGQGGANNEFSFVLDMRAAKDGLYIQYTESGRTIPDTFIGSGPIQMGQWYRIETEVRLQSTLTAQDGIIRVWIDGGLKYEKTNARFMPTNYTGITNWRSWYVGQQREGSDTGGFPTVELNIDERRYWDNVAFSHFRIGP